FKRACMDAVERFQPQALLVGASCTAELIQDDPGGLAEGMELSVPVVPLELPAYQKKENWGAAETFYRLTRSFAQPRQRPAGEIRANILGPGALGFRHRDNLREIKALLADLGVRVNVIAPWQATPHDIAAIPEADFNICLYPETAETACRWLERDHGMPYTKTVPIGVGATCAFIEEVCTLAGIDPEEVLDEAESRLPWYSRSVDSTYLTGKRVFVFGDATHAMAMARVCREEMGFEVVGLGTYSREFARPVRALAKEMGLEALITDDYLEVEAAIAELSPEMVLGTQMERHISKRLGLPCAVISAPVHVQDFPARHSPVMGFEGANVLFDTLVHPLVMGLEEHLLGMFRDDFEFHDGAGASHHGHLAAKTDPKPEPERRDGPILWDAPAEKELKKIPFFVRGKARRNTESFAEERGLTTITIETLYDAKAHFSR
ncbi:MAG: ferredoxin:protochlorophyllide reductase (ATP-dependent) subunit B, partial [Pseudomonadota bacterium]